MDIQKYIASGNLELYVLGELPFREQEKVRQYANLYPEIQRELETIEESLQQLATLGSVPPPISASAILQHVNNSELPQNGSARSDSFITDRSVNTPSVPDYSDKIILNKYLFIALTSIFILKGFIIGFLVYQQSETNKQFEKVNNRIEILQKDKQDIADAKLKIEQDFEILRSIAKKSITLKGTETSSAALAVVHWDAENKSVFVDLMNLESPPSGKQYQLWAIVDGKPTSSGIINSDTKEGLLQEGIFIPNPQAFAITLEPIGGSSTPTMEQIVVIGYV